MSPPRPLPKQLRNVCFTLNNYTEAQVKFLCEILGTANFVRYLVFGKEVGEKNGTPHLQGYIEFTKKQRSNTVRKLFFNKAHLEARKGTASQAAVYCKKELTDVFEFGTISNPGKRNDLKQFFQDVKDGHRNMQLMENHTKTMARYHRFANSIRNAMTEEKSYELHDKPIEVHVRYGPPGSGKTSYVMQTYGVHNVYDLNNGTSSTLWFDGYIGQKVLLMDDFHGEINYRYLLRLLDRYRMNLQVKGGFTYKAWEKVYITSNSHPSEWYRNEDFGPLERRFTTVTCITKSAPRAPDGGLGGPPKKKSQFL